MRARTNTDELFKEIARLRDQLRITRRLVLKRHADKRDTALLSQLSNPTAEQITALEAEIAQRKATEERLRESEERFRTLFEQMSEGFVLYDLVFGLENEPSDLRIVELNPVSELYLGIDRAHAIGKTVLQLLPHAQREMIYACGQVALTGESAHFQFCDQARNRYYEVFAYSPCAGQCACIIFDVTHRKMAEVALHETFTESQRAVEELRLAKAEAELCTNELASVLETMPEPVMLFDWTGAPTRVNPPMSEIFGRDLVGLTPEQYIAKFQKFNPRTIDGKPLPPQLFPSRRALEGEPQVRLAIRMTFPDGRESIVDFKATAFRVNREIRGVVLVARDDSRSTLQSSITHLRFGGDAMWTQIAFLP